MNTYFNFIAAAFVLFLSTWFILAPKHAASHLRKKWGRNTLVVRAAGVAFILWTFSMLAFEYRDRLGITVGTSSRTFFAGAAVGLTFAAMLMKHDSEAQV